MDATEVARQARAARDALEALGEAVQGLPSHKFNLGRSIEILGNLAALATLGRCADFSDAEILSKALQACLEKGCAGHGTPLAPSVPVQVG